MKRFSMVLLSFITAVSLLSVSFIPAKAFSPSGSTIYKGIDVSVWDGDIDYAKVKDAGVEVVYIRAGEGSDLKDTTFEANYTGAKNNGLKIGFYHYVTARTVTEAQTQAEYFVSRINGKDFDCRLAMDFESFGSLTKEEINQIALAFISKVVSLSGKEAVVYSDLSAARDIFDSRLSVYPLWIAEYGVSEPGDPGTWDEWVGFQYSDTGSVPGMNGNVDLDKFTDGIFLTQTEPSSRSDTSATESTNETSTDTGGKGFVYFAAAGASLSLFLLFMTAKRKKKTGA